MPVKRLSDTLTFTSWEDEPPKAKSNSKSKSGRRATKQTARSTSTSNPRPTSTIKTTSSISSPPPSYIALTSTSPPIATRIRTRHLPASSSSLPYPTQLNLNDLLDHAISILPSDAYALLLLVQHDLYEDDDDDFCVGRAYGGSRVAVVSCARYRPELDGHAGVDVSGGHCWPGSHCERFVEGYVGRCWDDMVVGWIRKGIARGEERMTAVRIR